MTNERYTFVSDLKDKKAAARGAYAKKGGSKSKRCSLPSDHLTPAELKRRNSPVSTVKLNTPIDYTEFRKLTPSLQYFYLDHLIAHYGARRCDIKAMLGCSDGTMVKILNSLPGKLIFNGRPKHPSEAWTEFINGQAPDPIPDQPVPPAPEPEAKPQEEKKEIVLAPPVLSGSITMVATLPDLGAQLLKLINGDTAYQFTVSFSRV